MAVTATDKKKTVTLLLNNGVQDGKVQTVNCGLGTLSTTGYDRDKAMAVMLLLTACLSKTVYEIDEVTTSTLRNS